MCVAIPGLVVETDGIVGKVDFQGNILNVNMAIVDSKIGDYVLVHAGCAIEVVSKSRAEEIAQIFAELESIHNEF